MSTDMFDEDDKAYTGRITNTRVRNGNPLDRMKVADRDPKPTSTNKLDSRENRQLFKKLLGYYHHEIQVQAENRAEMARDEEFYDNDQWTEMERNMLLRRGQQPLVFNVIATTINWMLGTQRRARTDHKILPRRKEGGKDAELKTKVVKYIDDVNRSGFHLSRCFKDQIVAGIGWMEAGVQAEDQGEPVYNRYESWRNILSDSLASEMDNSDARYLFRMKWVDLDEAMALIPDRKDILERAVSDNSSLFRGMNHESDEWMDEQEALYDLTAVSQLSDVTDRSRVRLIEGWFRKLTVVDLMSGGQFAGQLFDPRSNGHINEIITGKAKVITKTRMRVHYAIFCEAGLLFLAPSPYRHNLFPFTPHYCYRKAGTNQPYGMVRGMRDPQSDLNKRASKTLHILSTRRTIMDKGAVDDMRRYQQEVSRPDAVIVKNMGKDLRVETDTQLAQAHMEMFSRDVEMIQQIGGVTDENLGRRTNASSGKAITARQDQGALATAFIFDNLRLARQVHGEKKVSLIEQYMTDERQFRITDMRGSPDFVTINSKAPEAEGEDAAFEPNDITLFKVDFIVEEDEFSATIRQAQVEELMAVLTQLAQTAPDIALAVLDLAVETMDLPQRDEIVSRIRKISGQKDPDEDPNAPKSPEEMAELQAKADEADLARKAMELELADKEATVAEKQAKAIKAGAEAQKITHEVARILAETKGANIDVQIRALEAATTLFQSPALAGPADTILATAEAATMAAAQPQPPAPEPAVPMPPQPSPQPIPQ